MDNERIVVTIAVALLVDGVTLMLLRTTGVIAWPWWVVLLPLLMVLGVIVLLLNALAVREVAAAITRWVRNRRRG